jgi:hypothetical protein
MLMRSSGLPTSGSCRRQLVGEAISAVYQAYRLANKFAPTGVAVDAHEIIRLADVWGL